MTFRMKALTLALVTASAVGLSATGAGAVTTIKIKDLGPISGVAGNNGVSLPFIQLLESTKSPVVYDFEFQLVPPLALDGTTTTQIQAQAQVGKAMTNEIISFDLFSGTPGTKASLITSPTFEGASTVGTNADLTATLTEGSYFIQITPDQVAVSGEAPSGTVITSAIPEPTTWAAMFLGFGAIGASMRQNRRKQFAALTA